MPTISLSGNNGDILLFAKHLRRGVLPVSLRPLATLSPGPVKWKAKGFYIPWMQARAFQRVQRNPLDKQPAKTTPDVCEADQGLARVACSLVVSKRLLKVRPPGDHTRRDTGNPVSGLESLPEPKSEGLP